MKNTTQKLQEWAINKIKTEYKDDIAMLIALEGNSVNNDGHSECFDYFIPIKEKGYELSQTFIIGDIGYDLYSRSWESMEKIASLDDSGALCLGRAKIVYSRTIEDEKRFLDLKKKFYDNLQNKKYAYKKALEKLDIAMDLYRTMMFEDTFYKVRMAAGCIFDYLSDAIAYMNGRFEISWGLNSNYKKRDELYELIDHHPQNFNEYCNAIIRAKSIEELKNLSHLIINSTRRYLEDNKPATSEINTEIDFSKLADWYQELCTTWRRLKFYCDVKNIRAAFINAYFLQQELLIVAEEFNLKEMNLIGSFDADDLDKIKIRSIEIADYVVEEIEKYGVIINKYDNVEDFLKEN